MKVEDQRGHPWLVLNGDPAYPLVRTLEKLGYRYVVLTSLVLCGILPTQPDEQVVPSPTGQESSPDSLIRAVRLSDCMAALRKEGVWN